MAHSPEDSAVETRTSLELHADSLHQLAKKAVDKAFADAKQAGSLGSIREDTRSLTEIGD